MNKDDLNIDDILNGNDKKNTDEPAPEPPPEKKYSPMEQEEQPAPPRTSSPYTAYSDDTTKIRRMSDSTRAREIAESNKKSKKRKRGKSRTPQQPQQDYTYARERPEGEYLYTQVSGAKKIQKRKKKKHEPALTAAGTETLRLDIKDIVTMTRPLDAVQPVDVEPAPRAEKTSLNLGQNSKESSILDVKIKRTKEEAEAENKRRQEIMDLSNFSEIRADIDELRSAISFRMFSLAIVLFLSLLLMIPFAWVEMMNPVVKAITELLLGAAACVVCTPVVKNGIFRLLQLQADTDSLAAVSLTGSLFMMVINVFRVAITGISVPYYLPCIVLTLLMHTMGKMLIISREQMNLHVVSKQYDCFGMNIIEDEQRADNLARGILTDFPIMATIHKVNSLVNFRRYTYSADVADRFCRLAAPLVIVLSFATSAALTALRAESFIYGLMLFVMFTTVSSCSAITFTANLPLFRATRKMTRDKALMLGYQSVEDFYDTNSILTDASALFPPNSIKIAGIRMFTSSKMEEPIRCAASLAWYAGSALKGALWEVLQGDDRKTYAVENYVYEDSIGLSGWIHNQRILLGNRELMTSHNIEGLPSLAREAEYIGVNQEGIYLSVSGNLAALFLIEIVPDKDITFWMQQCADHDVCLILRSVDPVITLDRLSRWFDVPREMLKIIPARMHSEYFAEVKSVDNMSTSMACAGNFSGMAQLIIGSKSVRRSAVLGVFVQAVTILLGMGLVLMQAVLQVGLTPAKMLLLQCLASLITLIAVSIRRID